MDARSDVYVFSNGCKKCSDDSDGYYWESTLESRIHNEKLVQALLKGHSILSLKGSLSGDCDVEKNAAYMTLTGVWKKKIWLKGLMAESGYELSLVAGIATGALVKGGSRSEVPGRRKIEFNILMKFSERNSELNDIHQADEFSVILFE
ncbi:hypothetical protein Tco_0764639 [Tanacetum coccineum]